MSDLAGALDRIADLENRLEGAHAEGQRLKRELKQKQQDFERHESDMIEKQSSLEIALRSENERFAHQNQRIRELEDQLRSEHI